MNPSSPILTEFSGRSGQILERLNQLYPALIDLSLDRLKRLLKDLGNPEQKLPPIIHVAGTNGKGSVCAYLRAIGEAANLRVHVSTSPHLVDVTERFRIAGKLVSEEKLAQTLEVIEQVNKGQPITVFEVLTAAAFLLFSQTLADLAIIEVGLGGRFDATNVITPIACAITSISMDHEAFLGNSLERIAGEKAGIIKASAPVATDYQQPEVLEILKKESEILHAPLKTRNQDWFIEQKGDLLFYKDDKGELTLPLPSLSGAHQIGNAGLAVATLRASSLNLTQSAWSGITKAQWPARFQQLHGNLTTNFSKDWEVWLDGGHNSGAGQAIATMLKTHWQDRPIHLIVGMKQTKNADAFLAPLLPFAKTIQAVVETDQHLAMPINAIIKASRNQAKEGPTVKAALQKIMQTEKQPGRILICGSLYLAGSVLKQDGWKAT